MNKFINGPWELGEFGEDNFILFQIIDQKGNLIVKFAANNKNYEEVKEISQMIAVAPEAVQKLEKVIEIMEEISNDIHTLRYEVEEGHISVEDEYQDLLSMENYLNKTIKKLGANKND